MTSPAGDGLAGIAAATVGAGCEVDCGFGRVGDCVAVCLKGDGVDCASAAPSAYPELRELEDDPLPVSFDRLSFFIRYCFQATQAVNRAATSVGTPKPVPTPKGIFSSLLLDLCSAVALAGDSAAGVGLTTIMILVSIPLFVVGT